MKKKILAVLSITMAVVLASCGAKTIDVNKLASSLASEGKFAEQLTEVSSDITEKRYGIEANDVEECAAYAGTKAVVDEVAVFKASNVENVKEQVEQHIDAQKESYSSYRPDEVPKLDDCVVTVSGDYVIVCVSEDSTAAKSIIEKYTK